ncbi:beta-lactamase family protein [Microlunatus elymi]|uniref:Beta-lactamase family protein n=1 Tax=Microlunatus elymi TaxID=2596828 RepID=A0A516PZG6_9ACTN|nr:serine hydrolase domain-containing protein [Microlunatus elymi]QDP96575.1 beta-lactamase family protein [Microlunatus elymi]
MITIEPGWAGGKADAVTQTVGMPLERVAPEAVGVPVRSLDALLGRVRSRHLNLHSLLIIRHGRLVAELYWQPYGPDTLHRMYSVSKSFAGVAIGFCVDAGMIRLDDKIISYFGELVPDDVHPWTAAMTVEHLLTMSTAHGFSTYKQTEDTDLVRTYFTVPPTRPPGRLFAYDTSASVVLSALIERVTGRSMTAFLQEQLWTPLGCEHPLRAMKTPTGLPRDHAGSSPWWREVEDNPAGVDHAGSGILCTPRDLARFALFCLAGGRVDGRQLLSAEYVRAATSRRVGTGPRLGADPYDDPGYGYQFWRTPYYGFACQGMGGQLALVHPDDDLVVVTTADDQLTGDANDTLSRAVWDELLPKLTDPDSAADDHETGRFFGQLPAVLPYDDTDSDRLRWVEQVDRSVEFEPNTLGLRALDIASGPDAGRLKLITDRGDLDFCFGLGRWQSITFGEYGYPALAIGWWDSADRLRLSFRIHGNYLGSVEMILVFAPDGSITVQMIKAAEAFLEHYQGIATSRPADSPPMND